MVQREVCVGWGEHVEDIEGERCCAWKANYEGGASNGDHPLPSFSFKPSFSLVPNSIIASSIFFSSSFINLSFLVLPHMSQPPLLFNTDKHTPTFHFPVKTHLPRGAESLGRSLGGRWISGMNFRARRLGPLSTKVQTSPSSASSSI